MFPTGIFPHEPLFGSRRSVEHISDLFYLDKLPSLHNYYYIQLDPDKYKLSNVAKSRLPASIIRGAI